MRCSTWKAAHHAAQEEEAFASVEVLSRGHLSFEYELREKQLGFGNAMRCANTAELAERIRNLQPKHLALLKLTAGSPLSPSLRNERVHLLNKGQHPKLPPLPIPDGARKRRRRRVALTPIRVARVVVALTKGLLQVRSALQRIPVHGNANKSTTGQYQPVLDNQ